MVTRTVRTFTPAIRVRVSQGESLEHTVDFRGSAAIFRIIDDESHRTILSEADPGPIYRTTWQGTVGSMTAHGYACSFVAAVQYTWKATIISAAGTRTVVVDIDYASTVGTDTAADAISILVR
jgi:hypothetical protein